MKKTLLLIFMLFFGNTVFADFSVDEAFESYKKDGTYQYKYVSITSSTYGKGYSSVEKYAEILGYKITSDDFEKIKGIRERVEKIITNDIDGKISDKIYLLLSKLLDRSDLSNQTLVYLYSISDTLISKTQKEIFLLNIKEIDKKDNEIEASMFFQTSCIGDDSEIQKEIRKRLGCDDYKKDIMRGSIYDGMSSLAFLFLNFNYLENKFVKEIDDSYLGEYYCQNLDWKTECLWINNGKVTNITKYYW